jgi:DNA primase
VDFKEALAQLAEEVSITLEASADDAKYRQNRDMRGRSLKMHGLAETFFKNNLQGPAGRECRKYIDSRQLDLKLVESFDLGWSLPEWQGLADLLLRSGFSKEQGVEAGLLSKNEQGHIYDRFRGRLIFSIKDLSGKTIAFGGRIIDPADKDAAKYINSPDSPIYKKGDNVFGLFQARKAIAIKKQLILTEGYMDVLALHQFGYANSCALLGTAQTPEQVKRLSNLCSNFELLFDGDEPGRKAALSSCEMFLARGLNCRVVLLPEPEDIDSLLRKFGPETFEDLRAKALDGLTFCMRTLNSGYAPKEISAWVNNFLGKLEYPELAARYARELSRGLDLDETFLSGQVTKAKGAKRTVSGPSGGQVKAGPRGPDIDKQFLAFAVRYPRYVDKLRDKGLEFVLKQDWACAFWSKIIACAPHYSETEIFDSLDQREKDFWIKVRAVELIPPDPVKEELGLVQICEKIERIIQDKQNITRMQALSPLKGSDHEIEFLRIISKQRTGKADGGEKNE